MSTAPGNPCHKDADFPGPPVEYVKCAICWALVPEYLLVQGRCQQCHGEWLANFLFDEAASGQ